LGQGAQIGIELWKCGLIAGGRLGRGNKTDRHKLGQEGRGKQRDRVVGIGRVAQEGEERSIRIGMGD
jgi:hypothetical protein